MSRQQKEKAADDFALRYRDLNNTNKEKFARLANKLLNENFIYKQKDSDRNDYYDILQYRDLFENYFAIIDYDLVHNDEYGIFFLKTTADRNRVQLKKLESVLMIILRMMYYQASKEADSSSNIFVSVDDVLNQINKTGIYSEEKNKTEIMNAFRTLKKYKIIDGSFAVLNKEDNIEIYPTILVAVNMDNIDTMNQRLKAYRLSRGDEDETDEDQAD